MMTKMKTAVRIAAIAAAALGLQAMQGAMAHGSGEPRHGGVVQVANDVSFELVVEADGATLHLVDHGTPMSSKGISGKLTVLSGGQKTEADIKATEGNQLRATGVKIEKGAKVVAVLDKVEGRTVTVRFTIK